MTSIMKGLDAEAYDREYEDRELFRRIGRYVTPNRKKVWGIIISMVAIAILRALPTWIIAKGVDVLQNDFNLQTAVFLIFLIFVSGVGAWVFNWTRRDLFSQVIADMVMGMRQDAFSAAAKQDLSFYDEYSSGRIVSRITSDTQELGDIINIASDTFVQLASAAILIVLLFTIDIPLALSVVMMIPFVFFTAVGFRKLARRVTRQSTRATGEVNKSIQEAVTGISVAKNFRQEAAIYQEFLKVNNQTYAINYRRGAVLAGVFPVLNILSGIGTAILLFFGGLNVMAGLMTLGALTLFVTSLDRFWFPIMNISAAWSQFQQGLSASERVFALIDSETAVSQNADKTLPPISGEITFDHINFRYTEQGQVLNDFTLTIAPGESVAFVGHTGAGKSSIIKLIARFYEFQEGTLSIDGNDIRDLNLPAFRKQLGIVSQIPFLFDGTVADNIRYGRPEASDEDIIQVANKIGDGEWLETLPNGLDSIVGERGSRLSMGQRQLVALTRVLVQEPRIFILDEATASIDPFTETQIQQALDLIMQGRTSILIAHRLSTVRSADRIIVLGKGSIIEQGSHETLIPQNGHYAELYNTYFRHQSLSAINDPSWKNSA